MFLNNIIARLFLACALLWLFPFSQVRAESATVIAAFGDSLTAGTGVLPEDSFAAQLEKKLIGNGYNVRVINLGVPGDTTAGGLARIDTVLAEKPDIVLIELGTNDMLQRLPAGEMKKNLISIMERFHRRGVSMLVAGQKSPLTRLSHYSKAYDSIFCDLAGRYDALCYPFFLEGTFGKQALMQGDGLHPNRQGVEVIVNGIYPTLTRLLRKP